MADADLAELRKQCIMSLYLCTENISKYLDNEKETEFKKLQSYVKDYCVLEAQQEVAIQALEKAKNETDLSNVDTLQKRFTQYLKSLTGKHLKVDKHPYMLDLKKRIEKGLQSSKNRHNDSDFSIMESQEQYIDPITKKSIVEPMRNTLCGHIYERNSIMQLLEMNKRTKCPVVGCGNMEVMVPEHLMFDEEMKFRMTITQHSTMIQERSVIDLESTY